MALRKQQTNKHGCLGVYMWPLSDHQVYRIVLVQHQGGSYGSGEVGNGTGTGAMEPMTK